jgi:hypothetical protein
MALTRADLLLRRPKILDVKLSDGEVVLILELSEKAYQRIRLLDPKDDNSGLVAASVLCNPDGSLMFNPENPEDVKLCSEMTLDDSNRIAEAVRAKADGRPQAKDDASKN